MRSVIPSLAIGLSLLATSSFAIPHPEPAAASSTTAAAAAPQSTACGDVVNNADLFVFNASLVFSCLTSIPFNAAVSTGLLHYLNDTLQLQSTLAYLKNPPSSYQQRGVDLLAGLSQLQTNIAANRYPNQYAFEAELQLLLQSAHDAHLDLTAGALAVFSFGTEHEVVSVSSDGKELPKLYLADDMTYAQANETFVPSEIVEINGKDATEYLSDFAARNAYGTVEPHADWNQLMSSPALDIQGYPSMLGGGATLYPGDTIGFKLRNGTKVEDPWRAIFWSPGYVGPLATGGDFYNFFVLGMLPASYDADFVDTGDDDGSDDDSDDSSDDSDSSSTNATTTSWNSISPAYPDNPVVVQTDLGVTGGGFITGYFLKDISTAVLSIPSFAEYGEAVDTFTDSVQEFITKSKKHGMKKVVIDVLQNDGGNSILAIDTFKRFFPKTEPFTGSKMRAHPYADVIGSTVTRWWDDLALDDYYYYSLAADDWVVTDRINAATGRNFSSWEEFYGPASMYDHDNFTEVQRYNLSSYIFDVMALGDDDGTAPYGYANDPAARAEPYAAEDIVILSDGLCHSACALFMEMMHHEAGVRTVVVGGRPTKGPMQAPSGSRGASGYAVDVLDSYIEWVKEINETANATIPDRYTDTWITAADLNLRDQVRPNDTVPLQFVYEAADCRIFFTRQTIFNMTNLWKYAANAIWTDHSLCVEGSTGYATTNSNVTDTEGPQVDFGNAYNDSSYSLTGVEKGGDIMAMALTTLNDNFDIAKSTQGTTCLAKYEGLKGTCSPNQICVKIYGCKGGSATPMFRCEKTCASGRPCSSGFDCNFDTQLASGGGDLNGRFYKGFCEPESSNSLRKATKTCPPKGSGHAPPTDQSFFNKRSLAA